MHLSLWFKYIVQAARYTLSRAMSSVLDLLVAGMESFTDLTGAQTREKLNFPDGCSVRCFFDDGRCVRY